MPQLDITVWPVLVPYVVVGLFLVYSFLYAYVYNTLFSLIKKQNFLQFFVSVKTLF